MIYIGIDPDVEASGFAVWDSKEKIMKLYCALDLDELLHRLWDLCVGLGDKPTIIIESGWENKSSMHHKVPMPSGWRSWGLDRIVSYVAGYASNIGNKVGRNHEIGRQIEKYCIKYNIPYILKKPTKMDKKWNKTECKKFTGISESNPDVRDAIKLVFGR